MRWNDTLSFHAKHVVLKVWKASSLTTQIAKILQKFKYALVMRVYKWEPARSEAAVGYILNVFKAKSFFKRSIWCIWSKECQYKGDCNQTNKADEHNTMIVQPNFTRNSDSLYVHTVI